MTVDTGRVEQEHRPTQRLVPRRDRRTPAEDDLSIFEQPPTTVPPAEPPPIPPDTRKPTIDELFERYHEAHPEIYEQMVRSAREAKRLGHKRISTKYLIEMVRANFIFNHEYDPEVDRTYTINNVFTSRYSRLIMEQEPDLAEMFVTRALKSRGEK